MQVIPLLAFVEFLYEIVSVWFRQVFFIHGADMYVLK